MAQARSHTEIDWTKLVLIIQDVEKLEYGHELLDPQPELKDALCESCYTEHPDAPKGGMKSDEWAYWYDISRQRFVSKHTGMNTRFYESAGLTFCSICLAELVDRIDRGEEEDLQYRWEA